MPHLFVTLCIARVVEEEEEEENAFKILTSKYGVKESRRKPWRKCEDKIRFYLKATEKLVGLLQRTLMKAVLNLEFL